MKKLLQKLSLTFLSFYFCNFTPCFTISAKIIYQLKPFWSNKRHDLYSSEKISNSASDISILLSHFSLNRYRLKASNKFVKSSKKWEIRDSDDDDLLYKLFFSPFCHCRCQSFEQLMVTFSVYATIHTVLPFSSNMLRWYVRLG